jgi:hypothetical protein
LQIYCEPTTTNHKQQQEEEEEAYKAKYLRLKARFSKMAQDHIEEVGGLHEEIATLQERLAKTDAARCACANCGPQPTAAAAACWAMAWSSHHVLVAAITSQLVAQKQQSLQQYSQTGRLCPAAQRF